MRALSLLALLALTSTSTLAATRGGGTKITETRKIADFSAIDVEDGLTLEVKQGATSLTIEGDDNIVPLYSTEVVNGTLRIQRKSKEFLTKSNDLVVDRKSVV